MSDTFETALASVQEGNEPESTPEVTTPTGNEGTPTPTPAEDSDYPQNVRDYVTQNPDHKEIADRLNKEFKSAFTPRLQEAAEFRRRFEGVDENVLAGVRHLQQMIQTDPRNAAIYLREQAQLLEGTQAPEAAPDSEFGEYEPATEVEALLLREMKELKAWRDQQTQSFQQIERQQQAVKVQADFTKLEQEFGVQVPIEDRAKAWEMSDATGGKMSVADAYFAMHRSTLLPSLMQKARDEASGIVQTKQGMGVPGNLAERGGPAPVVDNSFEGIFNQLRG